MVLCCCCCRLGCRGLQLLLLRRRRSRLLDQRGNRSGRGRLRLCHALWGCFLNITSRSRDRCTRRLRRRCYGDCILHLSGPPILRRLNGPLSRCRRLLRHLRRLALRHRLVSTTVLSHTLPHRVERQRVALLIESDSINQRTHVLFHHSRINRLARVHRRELSKESSRNSSSGAILSVLRRGLHCGGLGLRRGLVLLLLLELLILLLWGLLILMLLRRGLLLLREWRLLILMLLLLGLLLLRILLRLLLLLGLLLILLLLSRRRNLLDLRVLSLLLLLHICIQSLRNLVFILRLGMLKRRLRWRLKRRYRPGGVEI